MEDPRDLSSKEVFARVVRDSIGNTVWFAIGAGIVLLIGHWSRSVGIVFFVIYALIIAADAVWFALTNLVTLFVSIPVALRGRSDGNRGALVEEGWMLLAAGTRLVEVVIGIAITWYLYTRIMAG